MQAEEKNHALRMPEKAQAQHSWRLDISCLLQGFPEKIVAKRNATPTHQTS